jgi:hypothetical protein
MECPWAQNCFIVSESAPSKFRNRAPLSHSPPGAHFAFTRSLDTHTYTHTTELDQQTVKAATSLALQFLLESQPAFRLGAVGSAARSVPQSRRRVEATSATLMVSTQMPKSFAESLAPPCLHPASPPCGVFSLPATFSRLLLAFFRLRRLFPELGHGQRRRPGSGSRGYARSGGI